MRSLRDQIIDRMIDGDPPILIIAQPECENPMVPAYASWVAGCRCTRCRIGKENRDKGQRGAATRRFTHLKEW